MKKKILALLLALVLCVSTIPISVLAETPEEAEENFIETDQQVMEEPNEQRLPEGEALTDDGLRYKVNENDTITITGYSGPGGNITIPSTIEDKRVSTIAYSAFSNNLSITGVTVEEGLGAIEHNAFYGCKNLVELSLPESITRIEYSAFSNCSLKNTDGFSQLAYVDYLYLDNNDITNLNGLKGLSNLTSVYLDGNVNLEDITPLKSLNNLQSVTLYGTKVSGADKLALLRLPDSIELEMDPDDQYRLSMTPSLGEWVTKESSDPEIFSYHDTSTGTEYLQAHKLGQAKLRLRLNDAVREVPVKVVPAEEEKVIANDENGIPDKILYGAVMAAADANHDNVLTNKETAGLTSLTADRDYSNDGITSLKGIGYLKNLESLYLYSHDKLADLKGIEALSKLTNLQLSTSGEIADIAPVTNLKNLTSLGIGGKNLSSLEGIENLTNLSSLNISGSFKDLGGIASLKQLSYLSISSFSPEFTNIKGIENLKRLLSLDIRADALKDITGIEKLGNLSSLSISSSSINDFQEIGKMRQLTSLSISNAALTNLDGLDNLKELTSLTLNSASQLKNLKGIEKLKKLQYLSINSANKLESLDGIETLTNLQNLSVSCYGMGETSSNLFTSFPDLSKLDQLTGLSISGSKIANIDGLKNLKSIRELSLGNNQLESINGIENLTTLESLNLGNNKLTLDNFEKIGQLKDLKGLSLSGFTGDTGNAVKSFDGVENLQSLKELNLNGVALKDVPMDGIGQLKNLELLDLSTCGLETLPDLTGLTLLKKERQPGESVYSAAYRTTFQYNYLTLDELNAKLPTQLTKDSAWIKLQEGTIPPESATDQALDQLKDPDVEKAEIIVAQPEVLAPDVFETAKETGKKVTVTVVDPESNRTKYSWTFDGKEISDTALDVNLEINVDSTVQGVNDIIAESSKEINAMTLSFQHAGNLPAPATVRIYVGDKYRDGQTLWLYYYNKNDDKMEMQSQGIVVKDGYAELIITHCSDYVLTDQELDGNKIINNGSSGNEQNPNQLSGPDQNIQGPDGNGQTTDTKASTVNTSKNEINPLTGNRTASNMEIAISLALLMVCAGICFILRKSAIHRS